MQRREQTQKEEVANTITHGLGIVFAIVALPFLIYLSAKHDSVHGLWAISMFGFGMLMVYFSSTIYHAVSTARAKQTMRVWDHISIFLMIGGSYTPFVYRFVESSTARNFLIVLWIIIALGCIKKIFFTGKYELLSVLMYLGLGWMIVFISNPMLQNIPDNVFWLLLWGGIAYTIGVVFYLWRSLRYHHAVWHCFVLIGTITHYFAVYNSISFQSKI
jgi:hemolysin III